MNSRLARYFAMGTVSTIVQFTALVLLVEAVHISETQAVPGAFVLGVAVNYGLQRCFTFQTAVPHSTAASRFFGIAVLSAIFNSMLFGVLNNYLPYILAQLTATLLLFLIN